MKLGVALLIAACGPGTCFMVPAASVRKPATVLMPRRVACATPAVIMKADWARVLTYPAATAGEFALITAVLRGIDALPFTLPTLAVPPLFFFLSLRSRIFSFIPASRPDRNEQGGNATPSEVKRPSWTPPGIAFPFIWLTISCLRAASSTLVWRACGNTLAAPPILALVAHLCIGDTWNAVTNVERRLGTSAVGVLAVLASVYAAVTVYYAVLPTAGLLLAPSALWISIATVLTWTIWSMNTPRQPLLPQEGEGKNAPLRLPLSTLFEK
jgi:benzodiazapine receptor